MQYHEQSIFYKHLMQSKTIKYNEFKAINTIKGCLLYF